VEFVDSASVQPVLGRAIKIPNQRHAEKYRIGLPAKSPVAEYVDTPSTQPLRLAIKYIGQAS
jgi:hypothetical protein